MQTEIARSNMGALLLAQQFIRKNPLVARHQLAIGEEEQTFLENLTPTHMQRLAECGSLLFSFRFSGDALTKLNDFIAGDDLALTQAELTSISGVLS